MVHILILAVAYALLVILSYLAELVPKTDLLFENILRLVINLGGVIVLVMLLNAIIAAIGLPHILGPIIVIGMFVLAIVSLNRKKVN